MHLKVIEVGDEHADLWEGLAIHHRRIDGAEDVTVGEHVALGLCVVSHFGFENRIEWFTSNPIAGNFSYPSDELASRGSL